MKLYACWGTFKASPRPGGHPCGNAAHALLEAGHEPEIVRSYGLGVLPDSPFNQSAGRRRAQELTGSTMVPVLELDDGTAIGGSQEIVAWAKAHPAGTGVGTGTGTGPAPPAGTGTA
ncbi:MAG: glutathione S-transferase domain-containing protein [Solirubrobacterales bacterium]|nr:glutathione S-transferase domain-containing protein [Solirubrobacterales bacterium]